MSDDKNRNQNGKLKYKGSLQSQEITQILQQSKEEHLKDKMTERMELMKQKQSEILSYWKNQTYQKSTAERKPFISRPRNSYDYFETNKSKYLKFDNNSFPDKDNIYFMLPDRAKNNQGFHIISGNDSSSHNLFGQLDLNKMGKKEKERYQIWEEIRKTKEREQQEYIQQKYDGTLRKQMFYDSKLISKPKVFQPCDSRSALFTNNPSSVYDVPRTPQSTKRLIQLNRNIEKNLKWNPNISTDGVFDKDIYKNNLIRHSESQYESILLK